MLKRRFVANTSLRTLVAIAISAILLMSFVPVLIRYTQANEATIGILRLAIGAAGIGLILAFRKRHIKLNNHDWRWLICLGLVFAVHWYSYFRSIKLADASLAAIGVATFGVHLLLLNSVILREKLNTSDLFAVAISFSGIYIASPELDLDSEKLNGFLLAIFSGFLYACLPLINRHLTHLTTNTRAMGQFSFGLIGFLFLLPQANFNLSQVDWISLAVLGVFCTLIAHTLWIKASTELPPNFTAVLYYGYVPLAMLLSYLFLGESITWQKIVGASLIISANIMVVFLHKRAKMAEKN